MSYYGLKSFAGLACCGFGQIDFNAPAVWSDWQAGGASGAAAAKLMQAALNQIGYGPLVVDGQFGAGSLAAWKRFANANGTGDAAWPSQVGILKLGDMVKQGGDQGGGGVIASHVEAGVIVPGAAPGSSKAGMGLMIGLGALALVAVAGLAIIAKKKKAKANRRRRARRIPMAGRGYHASTSTRRIKRAEKLGGRDVYPGASYRATRGPWPFVKR